MIKGALIAPLRILLAVTIWAAVAAAPAGATIVYDHGGEIWAMNDDGSAPRAVATALPLGMNSLGHPHVAPNGTSVVFDGSTNRNYNTACNGTLHYGLGATGVYRWSDGQVARLTPDPQPFHCGSDFETEPEATTAGRVVYGYFGCNGYLNPSPGTYTCLNKIWSNDLAGGGFQELPSCSGAESPTPNPADPNEYASVGCSDGNPVVARTSGNSTSAVSYDDAPQRDPSWRADGQRIVAVEGGGDPGIWDSSRNVGDNSFTYLLAQPNGVEFRSPRYMGAAQDKIVFSANGEIWTIPASCAPQGVSNQPCQFPAAATQLTSSGSNRDPAWTAQSVAAPTGPGGGNDPGGGTPGGETPGGGTPGGGTANVFAAAPRLAGSATSRSGVAFTLQLTRAATLRFTFYRGAKKFGKASRPGRAGSNRFRFRKVAGKRFTRGRYSVRIAADGASTKLKFRVRR